MSQLIDIDGVMKLQKDTRDIKDEKLVSITVSESTHQKLRNLCWLIQENSKPRLSLVTSNIIEDYFDKNLMSIRQIQSQKQIIF